MTPTTSIGAASAGDQRIASLAGPLFSLMIVLRRTRDLSSLVDLRETVVRLFEEFRQKATQKGFPAQDVESATYALAAAVDECVLMNQWSGRDDWQRNSLARLYCNDDFVGVGFYDRLAQIRHANPPRTGVVEVFYYCLVAGFAGKLIESPGELERLRNELSAELVEPISSIVPEPSSRVTDTFLRPIGSFPMVWVISVGLSVAVLFWLVMSVVLDNRADSVVSILERLRSN